MPFTELVQGCGRLWTLTETDQGSPLYAGMISVEIFLKQMATLGSTNSYLNIGQQRLDNYVFKTYREKGKARINNNLNAWANYMSVLYDTGGYNVMGEVVGK